MWDKESQMYIKVFYDLGYCYKHDVGRLSDRLPPENEVLHYIEMLRKEPVYRIHITEDGMVTTDCYDLMESFNPELEKCYESVDELPKWVQDKLAVLMLLDFNKNNKEVPNVGRRITKDIFWVFTRDGELDGDDPRG